MQISFLGDTHGLRPDLSEVEHPTIQVGDFGVGFAEHTQAYSPQFKFIRGNHDDPNLSRQHPSYLGEFGYLPEYSLFYMSGAASLHQGRIHGMGWWQDEELSPQQANDALELYLEKKPRIIVSHDAPLHWISKVAQSSQVDKTLTRQTLMEMWVGHQPDLWVFGHHHRKFRDKEGKTMVMGLAIRELMTVDITPNKIQIVGFKELEQYSPNLAGMEIS